MRCLTSQATSARLLGFSEKIMYDVAFRCGNQTINRLRKKLDPALFSGFRIRSDIDRIRLQTQTFRANWIRIPDADPSVIKIHHLFYDNFHKENVSCFSFWRSFVIIFIFSLEKLQHFKEKHNIEWTPCTYILSILCKMTLKCRRLIFYQSKGVYDDLHEKMHDVDKSM